MEKRLSARDVIQFRRVLSFNNWEGLVLSPDSRSYAYFVTSGDIERDGNWVELWAGRRNEKRWTEPQLVKRLFTDAKRHPKSNIAPVIHPSVNRVQWLEDSRRIAFLWTNGLRSTQVAYIDIVTGEMRYLTDHPQSVISYDVAPDGSTLVFSAWDVTNGDGSISGGVTVTADNYISLLYLRNFDGRPRRSATYLRLPSGETRLVTGPKNIDSSVRSPGLFSPDRRSVLFIKNRMREVPHEWRLHGSEIIQLRYRQFLKDPDGAFLMQSVVLNTETGEQRPLWAAPVPYDKNVTAVWAPSGHSVLIGPTYLPVSDESEPGRTGAAFALVDVVTGRHRELRLPESVQSPRLLRWDDTGIIVSTAGAERRLSLTGDDLVLAEGLNPPKPSTQRGNPGVELVEGANSPPAVRLTNAGSPEHFPIEPSVSSYLLGRVEMMRWVDCDGREWKGRLYYPSEYREGQRYPLVVQTHGYAPLTKFSLLGIDDAMGSVYAAQPLAARGMFVLQVDDNKSIEIVGTPREPQVHAIGFEAGVQNLVRAGKVDGGRVGISGYSRSGWYVQYALAFSDFPYAAAISGDNVGYGYVEAILNGTIDAYSSVLGGDPTQDGMSEWLANAVPFNAERIRTPLRLEVLSVGPKGFAGSWELFSRMQRAGLPVELYGLHDGDSGAHPLQNPRHRLAEQEGVVDWFDYWLNNRRDGDPEKSEQYRSWDRMRVLADNAQAMPRPARHPSLCKP